MSWSDDLLPDREAISLQLLKTLEILSPGTKPVGSRFDRTDPLNSVGSCGMIVILWRNLRLEVFVMSIPS